MPPKPRKYSLGHIYPTIYGTWRARVRIHGDLYEKNCKTLYQAQGLIDAIAINHERANRARAQRKRARGRISADENRRPH